MKSSVLRTQEKGKTMNSSVSPSKCIDHKSIQHFFIGPQFMEEKNTMRIKSFATLLPKQNKILQYSIFSPAQLKYRKALELGRSQLSCPKLQLWITNCKSCSKYVTLY